MIPGIRPIRGIRSKEREAAPVNPSLLTYGGGECNGDDGAEAPQATVRTQFCVPKGLPIRLGASAWSRYSPSTMSRY